MNLSRNRLTHRLFIYKSALLALCLFSLPHTLNSRGGRRYIAPAPAPKPAPPAPKPAPKPVPTASPEQIKAVEEKIAYIKKQLAIIQPAAAAERQKQADAAWGAEVTRLNGLTGDALLAEEAKLKQAKTTEKDQIALAQIDKKLAIVSPRANAERTQRAQAAEAAIKAKWEAEQTRLQALTGDSLLAEEKKLTAELAQHEAKLKQLKDAVAQAQQRQAQMLQMR